MISKYGLTIYEVFHCQKQIYQNLNTCHAENPPKTAEKTDRLACYKTLILTAKKGSFCVVVVTSAMPPGRQVGLPARSKV